MKAKKSLIKDLLLQTTFQSQLHQQSTPYNATNFKEVTITSEHNNKILPNKNIVDIKAKTIHLNEQNNDIHTTPSSFGFTNKTNVIHLDVKRRLNNDINNENNISLKGISYAPVNKNRRRTESKSDSPISSTATPNSIPTADLSSLYSTPISSSYSSKLSPAQNQRIESSAKNKVTPNDIGIDPPTSTVLLPEKPTVTPLFSGNKSTLGTEGVAELESAKEIKKNQNNRAYIDKLKKQDSICSEVVETKSYDLSTVFEEVQYRNNIPTTISNTNLGTVYGKYDNKLGIVKYKDKKDSVHRKKKVTTTNDNLLVLATTNTKIACRGRKKNQSINKNKIVLKLTNW